MQDCFLWLRDWALCLIGFLNVLFCTWLSMTACPSCSLTDVSCNGATFNKKYYLFDICYLWVGAIKTWKRAGSKDCLHSHQKHLAFLPLFFTTLEDKNNKRKALQFCNDKMKLYSEETGKLLSEA